MPPVSTIDAAISDCEVTQAAAIAYSGLGIRSTSRSASVKHAAAAVSGISVHQPCHGPAKTSAAAMSANVSVRVGLMRRSMSTTRSRSASVRHSHEAGRPGLDIRERSAAPAAYLRQGVTRSASGR